MHLQIKEMERFLLLERALIKCIPVTIVLNDYNILIYNACVNRFHLYLDRNQPFYGVDIKCTRLL